MDLVARERAGTANRRAHFYVLPGIQTSTVSAASVYIRRFHHDARWLGRNTGRSIFDFRQYYRGVRCFALARSWRVASVAPRPGGSFAVFMDISPDFQHTRSVATRSSWQKNVVMTHVVTEPYILENPCQHDCRRGIIFFTAVVGQPASGSSRARARPRLTASSGVIRSARPPKAARP